MTRASTITLLGTVGLAGAALVFGTALPAMAAPAYPRAEGRCVDQTGALGAALCEKVTAVLLRDEARSPDEIAVAVVPGTGDASIETWSTGLFNAWGVGKRDANNGVLLVVALDDHRLRLETGRGMSQRLSDARAATIVKTVITPQFAKGAYAAGILAGLDEVRRVLGHDVTGDARLSGLARVTRSTPVAAPADPTAQNVAGGGSGAVSQDSQDEHPIRGILLLLLIGGAVMALVTLLSRMKPIPSGGASAPRASRPRTARRNSSTAAGTALWSAESSSWSAGSVSAPSTDSGSSFGGGSSDGGGSSGGW